MLASARGSGSRPILVETLGAVAALALGALSIAFSESLIIAAVVAFGTLAAFVVVFLVCGVISAFVAYAFDAEEAHRGTAPLVRRVRAWIARRRATVEARAENLAHLSEVLVFVVLSVTVGPFLTTVAVKLRGGSPKTAYALSLLSSAVFSAVWVSIYSGGVAALRHVLGR